MHTASIEAGTSLCDVGFERFHLVNALDTTTGMQ